MESKVVIKFPDKEVLVWFNNYARIEIAKVIGEASGKAFEAISHADILATVGKMAADNHLALMRHIIWAGVLGVAYAKDELPAISRGELFEAIAIADQDEVYSAWKVFLSAMGMNLTAPESEKKKIPKSP